MGIFKKFFSGQLFHERKVEKPPVLQVHLTLPRVPLGDIQGELNVVADKYSPPEESMMGDLLSKTSSGKTLGQNNDQLLNLHEAELKKQASELYNDSKLELAAFLGAEERAELRLFYFKCFDFRNLGILGSLRQVCEKLYMKAESQHLDRIIDSFSERWVECNPKHSYKSVSHVYTLSYSIMLLNTDMCCTDDRDRMSRTKYVQTTFRAIVSLTNDTEKEWQDGIVTLLRNIYNSLQETPLRLASVQQPPQSSPDHKQIIIQRRVSMSSLRDRNTDNDAASVVSKLSHRSSWYQKSTYAPSLDSVDSSIGGGSVGFSSALWNAVIREEYANSDGGAETELSEDDTVEFNEVSTLELFGPPWAKEGLLKLVSGARRSRKRNSKDQVFVVVQRGYLKVFRFDRTPSAQSRSSSLGSGNWMQNATLISNVILVHTTAQITVNSCFALTLPNGSQVTFQAGTNEIAKEYVYTCNYWAARVSLALPEELVTSSEYGWERPLKLYDEAEPKYLSAVNHNTVVVNATSITLKDWEPPVASTVKSTLDEEDQLFSFQQHLQAVEQQLEEHSKLKQRLLHIYPSYAPVTLRVMGNWQKKNTHLLREVVKFKLYVGVLSQAVSDGLKCQSPNVTITDNA
ncbi:PH and SEC7 domain-containing protein [Yarrowia sp. C11]|nr:PH and SEC7 domain-containing protein [Yarrowia sp. C11]